jgi:type I restriction enzyme S subunit
MEIVAKKYKQTDVGIIPIDWDVKRLLDVSDFSNGKAHEQSIDESGNFVVVNSKFISTEGEIFKNSNQAISPLAKGDITLVMSDIPNGKALAKCYLIEIDNKYTLNQRICSIKTRVCDNVFLFYVLNRNKYFLSFDSGSGQTNLRRNEVLDCPLAIPPTIAEQTSIATAISNIDELIAQTEKLIEKKKAIKQGVMQELLKPKEGWVTKKFTDIVNYIHGKAHEQFIVDDGKFKVVNSKFISSNGEVVKYSNNSFLTAKKNDILTVLSDLPNGKALAKCFLVEKDNLYAVNQRVCIWRSKGADSIFLYYLLNRHKYFLQLDDGVTQTHILNGDINRFELTITEDLETQKEIGVILSDIDKEIVILEKRNDKLNYQKQGMMQALLTGKIRLI